MDKRIFIIHLLIIAVVFLSVSCGSPTTGASVSDNEHKSAVIPLDPAVSRGILENGLSGGR
jgi:hypothetical protein